MDWNALGLQLGVSHSRLKKIGRENKSEDECRGSVIHTWMNSDPEASWEKLSSALIKIDHRVLANKIDTQILPLLQRETRRIAEGIYNINYFSINRNC